MNLNDLAQGIFESNKIKGFWDKGRSFAEVIALIHSEASEALEENRAGRGVTETHYKWDLPPGFAEHYDVRELGGIYLVRRVGTEGNEEKLSPEQFMSLLKVHKVPIKPEGVPSEFADIIIRVLDACGAWGIDIEDAIAEKLAYNATRPALHGKKY